MATFKEALTTSLTNFAKSIAKTYPKTANIVDNLLSTDSTLPLSAKQGNVLQTQIDTLNSNLTKYSKPMYFYNVNNTDFIELWWDGTNGGIAVRINGAETALLTVDKWL